MNQQFTEILKRNKSSQTKERKYLFQLILDINKPVAMSELVRLAYPGLDRSTVYRTVDLFDKLGITQRVYTGWKYTIELSDTFKAHHHHFTCVNCGVVFAFEESQLFEREIKRIESELGCHTNMHSLELRGFCKKCK